MRPRMPLKYIVMSRDRLYQIFGETPPDRSIDQIKLAVINDLMKDGCTMCDIILIFDKYAIDFQARRAMIDIKRSVNNRHELSDEISFVTLRTGEEASCWDWYGDVL